MRDRQFPFSAMIIRSSNKTQQHAALGLSGRQLITNGDHEETTRTPTKAFFDRSWKMGNIKEMK
jgi:hypothetical protein